MKAGGSTSGITAGIAGSEMAKNIQGIARLFGKTLLFLALN